MDGEETRQDQCVVFLGLVYRVMGLEGITMLFHLEMAVLNSSM